MDQAARLTYCMNPDKPYQDYFQRMLESTPLRTPAILGRIIEENRVLTQVNKSGNKVSLRAPDLRDPDLRSSEKLVYRPRT